MEREEIEKIYEDEKARLTELYLKKVEAGLSRKDAEVWLRKNLKKARKTYYGLSESELKESKIRDALRKRFKPIYDFIDRLREQFE